MESLCAGPSPRSWTQTQCPPPPPCPSRPAGYRPAWGSYQLRRGPSKAGQHPACRVSVQQAHSFYCKCVVVRAGRGPRPLGSREGSLLDTPSLTGRPQGLLGPKGLNPQGPGLLGLPRTRAGPPPGPGAKLGDSNNGESWGSPLCPSLPRAPSECVRMVEGHLCPTPGLWTWLCFQRGPFW